MVRRGSRAFSRAIRYLVLLDVTLPRKNGFEVLQTIRRVSDVPVIMLTARGEELDQVRGLELGADDYVIKPFGHLSLLARMKAVLRRADLPTPIDTQPDFVSGDLAINFANHQVTVRGEAVKLTPVEYKLLYQLVRNAGRLLPHQALLDRVWGEDYGATTDHLKVFISRLRAKLELPTGQHFIETERGLGYRFIRPHEPAASPPPPLQRCWRGEDVSPLQQRWRGAGGEAMALSPRFKESAGSRSTPNGSCHRARTTSRGRFGDYPGRP